MLRRSAFATILALAGTLPAFAQTDDPSFRVINRAGSDINEVYATPAGVTNWGPDLLGNATIPPGGNYIIRLQRGQCGYDVRVVFADGQSSERRQINLCNVTDLNFP